MSNFNDMFTGISSPEETRQKSIEALLLKVRQIENYVILWPMKWH